MFLGLAGRMDMEMNTALHRARGDLRRARLKYPSGTWVHHVNSGSVYVIDSHSIDEEKLEIRLHYYDPHESSQNDHLVWSRLLSVFEEEVEYSTSDDTIDRGPRFVIIEDTPNDV